MPLTDPSWSEHVIAANGKSTVGSWEVRIWQTPTDASGWASAPVKVVIPLGAGEKATVLILDKPGGGVQVQVL